MATPLAVARERPSRVYRVRRCVMRNSWRVVATSSVLLCAGLAGCQLAALFGGHGTQPALFKFGKNQHVIVFVDPQEGVVLPPNFDVELTERLNSHLYSYKATDH